LTPTIPQQYNQHKRSGFPVGSCDTAAADGWHGSIAIVYEVNQWVWQFGCGKPHLGGLSVEKTGARKAWRRLLRGRGETNRDLAGRQFPRNYLSYNIIEF
jgi:hypothetical protein